MNLGEFHELVKEEANKGTRLDTKIPAAVRRAARLIERAASFQYMQRYVSFTLDPDVEEPRVAPLDPVVKAIRFIKAIDSTDPESYRRLSPVDPMDITSVKIGEPDRYWLDGMQFIWFDNAVEEPLPCEAGLTQYSIWPTDLEDTHWLIDNTEDVLLGMTMEQLAPGAREPDWLVTYGKMAMAGLKTLHDADYEIQHANKPSSLHYKPYFANDPRLD